MRRVIPAAETALKAVSHAACIVGGWLVILLSVGICVEVVLRKAFSQSLQGIDEYGGYALAVTASLGMAYCFYEHAHIKIDLVVRKLPKRFARVLSVIAIVALGIVVGMLALEAFSLSEESYMFGAFSNTPLRTPIYYPQAIWALGFGLFVLAIVLRLLHIMQSLLLNDSAATGELLGESGTVEGTKPTPMQGIE
ncbi:MAG: TRAP transporter small permease [Pseudomonadota bacterium]